MTKYIYNLLRIIIIVNGANYIITIKRLKSIIMVLFIIILAVFLIFPGIFNITAYSLKDNTCINRKIIAKLSKEIEIPAESDYYIKFSSENLTLIGETIIPYALGLSDKVKDAVAKSPHWIQRDLTRQFHAIDAEEYADLILNMSKKYVDEIAFSIAYSSLSNVPHVDLIRDNVLCLYENDKWIQYADIVDYDNGAGDYYSTIKYWMLENETEKQLEYPREIYYWYVVHPEVASENAEYIYEKFWRDYLFNHNDLGYPLLQEKLSEIDYLWDYTSYFQPGQRLWKWSMENHPTAVEAVSYWIGKTVPEQAYGSRPGQPNIIAHEHNGWCGELQRIAVAALRTALIPSVGICDHGEDHVWREFYDRGWHQSDNWWADGGGAVDKPYVYVDGGKNISALFAWKGDDSVYEVTSRYIHPEDRVTVKFVVRDRRLQPVDGARITAVVRGPKDITWLKNKIWERIEEIWDWLPEWLKGRILQTLYNKFKERYDQIPDSIDGFIPCIWNYTNMDGECTLELGKNRSYLFIIQQGNLQKPWQLARNNALRIMSNPRDKTFHVVFPLFCHRVQRHHDMEIPDGEIFFNVSFSTTSYQLHESILWIDDKGVYNRDGKIDFFILDEENFKKYRDRERFNCFNYINGKEGNFSLTVPENNWYIVFRNTALQSNVILDFSIRVETSTTLDRVQIVSPDTSIFDNPVFDVGETVNISGIATDDILLYIDSVPHAVTVQDCGWFYEWNTSEMIPGDYLITAECGDAQDEMLICLIDTIPPMIEIDEPSNGDIVDLDEGAIEIVGHSWDNLGVERVEVSLDNGEWREAMGTENWSIYWNITEYELGDHTIYARVFDKLGRESVDEISLAFNKSGHNWGPEINSFYHQPENPTNVSNVVIYANVTEGSPFNIQKVVLYWDNGTITKAGEMYRYGDNPVQDRHEEDPLKNESNDPIFGFELGQFLTGENITYWIVACDTASNTKLSGKKSFIVD